MQMTQYVNPLSTGSHCGVPRSEICSDGGPYYMNCVQMCSNVFTYNLHKHLYCISRTVLDSDMYVGPKYPQCPTLYSPPIHSWGLKSMHLELFQILSFLPIIYISIYAVSREPYQIQTCMWYQNICNAQLYIHLQYIHGA